MSINKSTTSFSNEAVDNQHVYVEWVFLKSGNAECGNDNV